MGSAYVVCCDCCREIVDTDKDFTLPAGWAKRNSGETYCEFCVRRLDVVVELMEDEKKMKAIQPSSTLVEHFTQLKMKSCNLCLHHGGERDPGAACETCNEYSNFVKVPVAPPASALDRQEGGSHYKDFAIQPAEFIHANKLAFLEGCVIKRMCRWRNKDGVKDLRKAIHEILLLIELEERQQCSQG